MSQLFTSPFMPAFSNSGLLLPGAKLKFYASGTLTPATVYADEALTTSLGSTVTADASGRFPNIFLNPLGAYRVKLTTALDVVIGDVEFVNGGSARLDLNNVTFSTQNVDLAQVISPLQNAETTLNAVRLIGETQSSTMREFMITTEFTINKGAGLPGDVGNKCAHYDGVSVDAGAGTAWARNTEFVITPGAVAGGLAFACAYEIDVENYDQDIGSTAGVGGLNSPSGFALAFGTGASPHSVSAATLVNTINPANKNWARGHVVYNGVLQESFADYSTSANSYQDWGSHETGLNLIYGSYSIAAIALPNNAGIVASNTAETNILPMIKLATGDNLHVGGSGVTNVIFQNNILPLNDNAFQFGSASNRFTALWAANGTIQTSDPSLKTDMADLPDVSDLFDGTIQPKSFRWLSGGVEMEDVEEERQVPVTEAETVTETYAEMVDGVAVQKTRPVTRHIPVYDSFPVFDEAGNPVMATRAGKSSQAVHRKPRMRTETITVQRPVERQGNRTHFGWDASQWEQVAGLLGLPDFGGFVVAEDGTLALRPDQIIPILWRQVMTLTARIAALEAA